MVAHAGSVAVRMLADRVGLTGHLCVATTRRGFIAGHDRGRVLVDLATMVPVGGEAPECHDTAVSYTHLPAPGTESEHD